MFSRGGGGVRLSACGSQSPGVESLGRGVRVSPVSTTNTSQIDPEWGHTAKRLNRRRAAHAKLAASGPRKGDGTSAPARLGVAGYGPIAE